MTKSLLFILSFCLLAILTSAAVELYAFVIDIEPRDIYHEYCADTHRMENPPTLAEWMERQERPSERFLDWVAEGGVDCFDWSSPYSSGHHENN